MVIRNYHWLNSASPNIDLLRTTGSNGRAIFHCLTLTFVCDLNLQFKLAKVKIDRHAKNQGQRSNGSNRRVPTNGHTHGHYRTYYLPCYAVNNNYLSSYASATGGVASISKHTCLTTTYKTWRCYSCQHSQRNVFGRDRRSHGRVGTAEEYRHEMPLTSKH